MECTFLVNASIRGIFTHAPPTQNSPPISCHHALGRRNYSIPQAVFFRKSVFPNGEEETMIYFMKVQSENMKMTWDIKFLCLV